MAFTYRETSLVKGMLARGDKQHDIASYFAVNGGRVAEVSTGDCDYPNAKIASDEILPPPGPYMTKYAISSVIETLQEAIQAIEMAEKENELDDLKAALILAKDTLLKKIETLEEV